MNNLKILLFALILSLSLAGCASEEVVEVGPEALKGTPTGNGTGSGQAAPGQGAAGKDIVAPQ